MFKYFFCFVIYLTCNMSDAYAQGRVGQQKVNDDFNKAVQLYNIGQLNSALLRFERIINNYSLTSKTTASYFFKIKILIGEHHYEEADETILLFIENFPTSKYIDEIRILAIKSRIDNLEYYDAFKETAFLIDNTKSIVYRIEAKDVGEKIANNYLISSELRELSDIYTGDNVKPYLLLLLGKAYLKERDKENALSALLKILENYPLSEEYAEAKNLYDNPVIYANDSDTTSNIGVLLPLQIDQQGYSNSSAAKEILEGFKFAFSEFNQNRDDKIGIVIRDTRNDVDKIDEIKDEFKNNPSIKAILGPIFSSEVRYTLNEFEGSDIPIISPTATDDDLTFQSKDFFQANPSLGIRGKVMAQYVFYVENKKIMAVLNSIDGYSPLLAAAFIEEFEKLGGTILVKATYKSNSFSLAAPISTIMKADTLQADTLQGIYIPLSDKIDATAILSQMGQDSLYLPIYGNQDWFSAKGFESAPGLSNMLTFSSDYFIDFTDADYQEFSNRYVKVYGKDPNRNTLYGYDAAKFLLSIMRNIVPTRSSIENKIISGFVSNGFHNNISFDEYRINRFLNIVRYKDGVFELIDKFRYGN